MAESRKRIFDGKISENIKRLRADFAGRQLLSLPNNATKISYQVDVVDSQEGEEEESEIHIDNVQEPLEADVHEINSYFDAFVSATTAGESQFGSQSPESESVDARTLFLYSSEGGGGTITIEKRNFDEGSFSRLKIARLLVCGTEKEMAVKVTRLHDLPAAYVDKFLRREILIISQIRHPHIIAVNSIFVHDRKLYALMELATHGNVIDHVRDNGAVEEDQCRTWFSQASSALLHCHGLGIVHRDVKCDNLLIDNNLVVKLCDFGFARFFDRSMTKAKPDLSETYCGTVEYSDPDVIERKPYNPFKSDVWSLGVCLYVMLNRALPFEPRAPEAIVKILRNREWIFRPKIAKRVSADVQDLVRQMMEPDVDERPDMEQVCGHPWLSKCDSS